MFNRLVYPVVYAKKIPPALGLSLGALFGVVLAVFVVGQRAEFQTRQLLNEYGHALVTLTAAQAVDSLINHDLVGLHAILQESVAEPRVVFAAIYDANQKTLVQSGEPLWLGKKQVFSAPVALQDNYAGRVEVALSAHFEGDDAVRWALLGVIALLGLMVALSLYDSYGSAWRLHSRPLRKARDLSGPTTSTQSAQDAEGAEGCGDLDDDNDEQEVSQAQSLPESFLYLQAVNAERLRQQLNAELYREVLASFQSTVEQVFVLYPGSVALLDEDKDIYVIKVYGESAAQAQFQALCAGQLLTRYLEQQKLRLRLAMMVTPFDGEPSFVGEGVYCIGCEPSMLEERFEAKALDDEVYQVTAVQEPYHALLVQQVERLSDQ